MPRASPLIASFNGGELSPLLHGRTDIDAWRKSVEVLENMIARVEGPATTRPGFRYIAQTRFRNRRAWLLPFVFSRSEAYVLLFEPGSLRFFVRGGQLLAGGDPLQLVTPYEAEDLWSDDDQVCPLHFEQSGDVMWITHPRHRTHRLERRGATDWSFEPDTLRGGPLREENTDDAITVYATAQTGSLQVVASDPIFRRGMVGGILEIWEDDASHVPTWEVEKSVAAGLVFKSGIHFYRSATAGTTGTVKPTHTAGTASDGGVEWTYEHSGFGRVRVDEFISQTEIKGAAQLMLPSGVVGFAKRTTRFSLPAFDQETGYPSSVTLWRERLWFCRGRDVYASTVSRYGNFSETRDGEVTADASLRLKLAQRRIEGGSFIAGLEEGLVFGSAGGEYVIREQSDQDGLSADNITARPFGTWGASKLQPVVIDDGVLFVSADGERVLLAAYDLRANGLAIDDLSAFASHVTKAGIVQIAFQREPWRVLWCVLRDGTLAGLTLDRRQQVAAWHRHQVGGERANVRSVCVVPREGGGEELWCLVSRDVHAQGQDRTWSVERMAQELESDDPADARQLDAWAYYEGDPVETLAGLRHLAAETVRATIDGAPTGPLRLELRINGDGVLQLPRQGSRVVVGYPFEARLRTLPIEAGAADGTAQGKTQRVHRLGIRLLRSAGGVVGSGADFEALNYREPGASGPLIPPLYSGDLRVPWPGGYTRGARLEIVQRDPLPLTVLAIMPQLTTEDVG